jgi:hypothetical protein
MIRWDWYRFDKTSAGTRYAKVVFLLVMGSAGHVVHSGASRAQHVDALFFMLEWARSALQKMCAMRHYI